MKKKNLNKIIPFAILQCVLLGLWIVIVDPYPDRDSVSQFYYPFLSSIDWTRTFGLDIAFQNTVFGYPDYPKGFMLFSILIGKSPLAGFFLDQPYLSQLLLLIPLIHVLIRLGMRSTRQFWVAFALFMNPFTLYCLRSFSLQSFNVIFSLAAIFLLEDYLRSKSKQSLIASCSYLLIAIVFKHLGLIIIASYGLFLLICSRQYLDRMFFVVCVFFLAGCGFYNIASVGSYWEHTLTHNPSFDFLPWLAMILTGLLVLWLLMSNSKRKSFLYTYPAPTASAIVAFTLLVPVIPLDVAHSKPLLITTILGLLVCVYDLSILTKPINTQFKRLYSFAILSFFLACLLYFSLLGKVYFAFFPSTILLCVTLAWLKRKGTILVLAIGANLFPSIRSLEAMFGQYGLNWYINGMNAVHVNYWGWQTCDFSLAKRKLIEAIENLETEQDSLLMIPSGIHPHMIKALEIPFQFLNSVKPIVRLDQLPKSERERWFARIQLENIADLVQQKAFPIIMLSKDTSIFANSLQSYEEFDQILASAPEEEQGLLVSSTIGSKLKQSGAIQRDYRLISTLSNEWDIYLHNSFSKMRIPIDVRAIKEQERADFYSYQLPKLPEEKTIIQNSIDHKIRAGMLFLKSNSLFESDPQACIQMLKEVLELDPNHKGAKEDLEILLKTQK